LVLAAIATVTGRARLAASLSTRDCDMPDALARRMITLDRLSRGRVMTTVVPAGEPNGTETLIAHAHRIGPALVLLPDAGHAFAAAHLADGLVSAAGPAQCHAAFDQARLRRERERLSSPFELWTRAPAPEGREQWRGVVESAAAVGATGLVVPFGPRLLDLLRNGDEEDDRSDLTLAQG
jgi:hypothetical protein